jgi:hypothetical protein
MVNRLGSCPSVYKFESCSLQHIMFKNYKKLNSLEIIIIICLFSILIVTFSILYVQHSEIQELAHQIKDLAALVEDKNKEISRLNALVQSQTYLVMRQFVTELGFVVFLRNMAWIY